MSVNGLLCFLYASVCSPLISGSGTGWPSRIVQPTLHTKLPWAFMSMTPPGCACSLCSVSRERGSLS